MHVKVVTSLLVALGSATMLQTVSFTAPACAATTSAATPPFTQAAVITPTASTAAPTPSSTVIKGGVQKTAKEAMLGIKSISESDSKLKHAVSGLFKEVTVQNVEIIDEPEIIGDTVISIPINFNLGSYLPPRKKWVDYHMNEISQLIPLMQEDVQGLLIPDDKAQEVGPIISQMSSTLQDIEAHYNNLVGMTKAPPYDNQAIASECKIFDDDIKSIIKLCKDAYHKVK